MIDMGGGQNPKHNRFRGRIVSASILLVTASPTSPPALQYLLTKRSDAHPTLGGAMCFPGGTLSAADTSSTWRAHFSEWGVDLKNLELLGPGAQRPPIYEQELAEPDGLSFEMALRITAIRETFEECGILLCVKKGCGVSSYDNIIEDHEEVLQWQKRVRKSPLEFSTLCKHFNCVPDLDALYEWNDWATPGFFRPRFDTLFYIATVPTTCSAIIDPTEVEFAEWMTPKEALERHYRKEIFLPTPQFYEMSRLKDVSFIVQLKTLMSLRRKLGIELFCAQYFTLDDGFLLSLPGDHFYDNNQDVDEEKFPTALPGSMMEALQDKRYRHHRVITRDGLVPMELMASCPFRFGQSYEANKSSL